MNERKSLFKNSIYNIVYRGFSALFPLITTAYLSRVLLPNGVGRVSYANTIVCYFITIASLGIPNYGIKIISQYKTEKEKQQNSFWELFLINFISSAICITAYYLFVNNWAYYADRRYLFNIMGIALILNVFNIDWFYQGIEEYGYIATRSIIIKVGSLVAMLLFVHSAQDDWKYALILCVATAGNYILNMINVRKYIGKADKQLLIARHIRPILTLLAASIATEIYTMLDTVMLEYFQSETAVGYYSNSTKIIRMVYTVVIAMVTTFFPRISYYYNNGEREECSKLLKKGFEIVLLFSLPCVVGIFMLSDSIVLTLFGEAFTPSITTLKILSVLIFIFSTAYSLGHIILLSAGKEQKVLKATIIAAISNTVMNYFLIPRYSQNGAAVASVVAELIVTTIIIYNARKVIHVTIDYKYVLNILLANAVMGVTVGLLNKLSIPYIPKLIICIIIGAVIYFTVLLLLHNRVVTDFKNSSLEKVKKFLKK